MLEGTGEIPHARFGAFGKGEGSAGIEALRHLTTPEEFQRLLGLSKDQLEAEHPGLGGHDAYEGLERLGAKAAKDAGHDMLVLRDKNHPEFSEAVSLDRSAIEWDHEQSPAEDTARVAANDAAAAAGGEPARGEAFIAADPELRALKQDIDALDALHPGEPGETPARDNPNTIAEAIRAAAVCLIGEL